MLNFMAIVYYYLSTFRPPLIKKITMELLSLSPLFLKKRRGYCNRLRPSACPSVCTLCYLLLNHWTKFNQIWCVCQNGACNCNFFAPPPGALGRGQKVRYRLISITKSISKIIIPNFVCVLTIETYKKYRTGFLFRRLGHAPRVGLRGAGGTQGGHFFQT